MSWHSPTLKQLRYLVALDDAKHYRRAAERCNISQPSLSAQVQNIEQVLGVQLVERSRSGVTMTPVGREVVDRGRRVLDEVQGIVDFAVSAQSGLTGTIRLGAQPTLGPYLLPHVVAHLHREYPDLNLYIREGPPRELEHELGRGLHDVILTLLPVAGSELVTERLFREPLYLAMAADHPFAAQSEVSTNNLKGLDVLAPTPMFHLRDQIGSLCQEFGANVLRDYEGTSLDALRQMVGMGMGVTFLPALYVHSEVPKASEIVVKPLKGRTITRSIGIVWRKSAGRVSAYQQIAGTVRDVAAKAFDNLIIER